VLKLLEILKTNIRKKTLLEPERTELLLPNKLLTRLLNSLEIRKKSKLSKHLPLKSKSKKLP